MKNPLLLSLFSVLGTVSVTLPASSAVAQTAVTTTPVGYLQTSCLSSSDTLVAPPFTRPAAFTGAVSAISGSTITLASSSLTADQFDAPTTTPATTETYYLSVGPLTATLAGTVSVTSGSTTVTGTGTTFGTDVKVNDRITINDGYNLLTYTVTAIATTTSLTIDRAFSDAAATGSTSGVTNTRTASARGAVTSATTLSGLAATYDHSPYEGRFYQVVSNTASTVTVNLNNDTPTLATGTQVSIIPYWTLNKIFPASDANVSFIPTTSTRQTNNTQILVPNYAGSGINLATGAIYIYYSSGSNVGWRNTNDLTTDCGNVPMEPDGYFTLRNPSTTTLPVTFSGGVPVNKLATALSTLSTGLQDNAVALNRPAPTTLGALGLGPTNGSFVPTTSTRSVGDQLFIYNNAVASFNKSSSAIYVYYNSGTNVGWRNTNDLATDASGDVIAAGSAITIRKAVTTPAQTVFWNNSPNY